MATWRPDPSFYPSPRMAMAAPAEKLAYVVAFDPSRRKPDALSVFLAGDFAGKAGAAATAAPTK